MKEAISEWIEADDSVEQCESCPYPNGCIRSCNIEDYQHEDVAAIREESQ